MPRSRFDDCPIRRRKQAGRIRYDVQEALASLHAVGDIGGELSGSAGEIAGGVDQSVFQRHAGAR